MEALLLLISKVCGNGNKIEKIIESSDAIRNTVSTVEKAEEISCMEFLILEKLECQTETGMTAHGLSSTVKELHLEVEYRKLPSEIQSLALFILFLNVHSNIWLYFSIQDILQATVFVCTRLISCYPLAPKDFSLASGMHSICERVLSNISVDFLRKAVKEAVF